MASNQVDRPRTPSFWNDLYWFGAVCLGGFIVAALALPPRMARTLELAEQESRVHSELLRAHERERALEQAIEAMGNDPFYQAAMVRKIYGIKAQSERYLEAPAATAVPITPLPARPGR
jgi:hypothetical protein